MANSALGPTIRPMQIEDIPAGLNLCRLAGWNQLADDWLVFLNSPVGGGRLAESNGITVGTAAFLRYGCCFSWLSMMLVHPDARRAGIGARLIDAAMEALAGEAWVRLDATPLGEPLYRRYGFREEYELIRTTIAGPARHFPPIPENARPMQDGDLPEVLARDRQVFGADRSRLLASFFRRSPGLAWTARRGKSLLGYCFGRTGHIYRHIGPVVGEDASVAGDLVAACCGNESGGRLTMDVPRLMPEWIAWLEKAGFATERPFLRMSRGRAQEPELPAWRFAIAGPEFG